jgi:hypothetical protein
MHLGQVKRYVHLFFIPKTDQFLLYFFIIQEGEFIMPYPYPLIDTRIVVKIIILTQFALIEDIVNHLAAVAAKHFFFCPDLRIQADFTTMITMDFLFGKYCRGHKGRKNVEVAKIPGARLAGTEKVHP